MDEIKGCRICGGEFRDVLDLGKIYPSGFVKEQPKEESKAPLVLVECENCGLVQLKHTIDLDLMYRQYWYSSSLNKSMVSSLKDVVQDIESRGVLKDGDTVLDIGCNDGTLLESYSYPERLIKVGFDPALNLGKGDYHYQFVNDYFSFDKYNFPKAKIITAIAMFYDLPDPNKFVEDVKEILSDGGLFVVQFTDLLSMIKATAFDNICHEHLEYYRLEDVINLLKNHNLEVIDVSYNDVNGGSVRVIAGHKDKFVASKNVEEKLSQEREFLELHTMEEFSKKIETIKFKIREFLKWAEFHHHRIFLMGASTKGNTLIQVCGIDGEKVPFAAEVNSDKFGLKTVGSDITIIPETEALIKHPDYFIVPVWHFKSSLLKNQKILDFMLSGGRLVFPLPDFHVVYLDYNKEIKEVRI